VFQINCDQLTVYCITFIMVFRK